MKKLVPLLVLVPLLIVGCTGGPITITGPSQLPAINSFNASPDSISAGESSSLSWTVTGATTVSIDQGIGNVALAGTRGVAPAATTIYTLTASSAAGSVTATTQVIVAAPSPAPSPAPAVLPVVNYFTASPPSVSYGNSTTLSWNVSNATSVTIDNGVGAVGSSGSTIVLPSASTNFTLTASNAAGSTIATAPVLVSGVSPGPSGLPVINYFTASPPVISSGGSTTLSWDVSNATSVTIDNGIGFVPSSGTILVTMSSSTNFTLTASNPNGQVYLTAGVIVTGGGGTSVAYDFVEQAPTAYWWTIISSSVVVLPFPGATNDNRGFVTYQDNIKLNDGNTYTRVLETHPQWVNNGFISGKYSGVYVPPGAKLRIKIGLIKGAAAGNVEFHIGKFGAVSAITRDVAYADGVQVVEADLSAYAGQTIDFVLGTNANGSSAQDWAAWAEAKIIY
jgi:hypothetical protein